MHLLVGQALALLIGCSPGLLQLAHAATVQDVHLRQLDAQLLNLGPRRGQLVQRFVFARHHIRPSSQN
jgi:hypothetical protein